MKSEFDPSFVIAIFLLGLSMSYFAIQGSSLKASIETAASVAHYETF